MLKVVNIDLLLKHYNNSVLSELDVQDLALKVEFSKRPMLYVIPEYKPVAGVRCIVASAHKANYIGSKQHFTQLDASFKI